MSKQLLPISQNDTGVLSKTTTLNIPKTKKEHTKYRVWSDISWAKFKEIKNRPEYSKEFDEIWKFYRRACLAIIQRRAINLRPGFTISGWLKETYQKIAS